MPRRIILLGIFGCFGTGLFAIIGITRAVEAAVGAVDPASVHAAQVPSGGGIVDGATLVPAGICMACVLAVARFIWWCASEHNRVVYRLEALEKAFAEFRKG